MVFSFLQPILIFCCQVSPLATTLLKVKLLDFGDPRSVLSKALSPPNLGDLVNTMLQLKGVNICFFILNSCFFLSWMLRFIYLISYIRFTKCLMLQIQ